MKIKRVEMEQKNGCSVACIAMVLGWTYQQVADKFQEDFDNDGLTPDQAGKFISDQGYECMVKEVSYYAYADFGREEMLKPFAPIHIVSCVPSPTSEHGHAVIMLADGKIIDPEKEPWPIEKFYRIRTVTGIWKIKS